MGFVTIPVCAHQPAGEAERVSRPGLGGMNYTHARTGTESAEKIVIIADVPKAASCCANEKYRAARPLGAFPVVLSQRARTNCRFRTANDGGCKGAAKGREIIKAPSWTNCLRSDRDANEFIP